VAREIRALDPDLPIFDVTTMERMIQGPNGFFLLRMGALFGGALGLLGLALALVGVYGVVSYAASQRTQEIGLRMAIGAQRGDVVRLVVGGGMKLAVAGVAIGIACALGLARLVATMLYEVTPFDPASYSATAFVLLVVAALACYVPARRALRVDPIVALRQE
jgi:putative ABC transport system permease protein